MARRAIAWGTAGTVALSGFAKSSAEKAQAEYLARTTKGVFELTNRVAVRP